MNYDCLKVSQSERITTLALNRPERLNALNDQMREELLDAILSLGSKPTTGAIILTGEGRGFCSGGDVKRMRGTRRVAQAAYELEQKIAPLRDKVVLAMRDAPVPIIAAINGPAAGAGMNLALACDIRIASEKASFAQSFVKRGLHVDWGGTYLLPRAIGMAKAAEMIFTGRTVSAEQALAYGVVSQVVSEAQLMPTANALAEEIAAGPPIAIRLAKRALYHNQDCDLRQALEFETYAQTLCRDTDDAKEGILAFVEKRKPSFTGK